MPRPTTYITHTKGGDQRPRDRVHMAAEAKSQERERRGGGICRKKLPEAMEGKKIKKGKQKRGSSCLVNTPTTYKQTYKQF